MKLYLVRHGEYSSFADQTLSETGIRETQAVVNLLKPAALEIDEILHSVKRRAQQTAEILAQGLAPHLSPIERTGLKPSDPIEAILTDIHTQPRQLMLVGHLPFMERLLSTLLYGEEYPCPVDFCCACVVCLERQGRQWQIAWVVSPKLVGDL